MAPQDSKHDHPELQQDPSSLGEGQLDAATIREQQKFSATINQGKEATRQSLIREQQQWTRVVKSALAKTADTQQQE